MDELVNLIVGSSTTLDIYFVARVVVLNMCLELTAVMCAMLSTVKGR